MTEEEKKETEEIEEEIITEEMIEAGANELGEFDPNFMDYGEGARRIYLAMIRPRRAAGGPDEPENKMEDKKDDASHR